MNGHHDCADTLLKAGAYVDAINEVSIYYNVNILYLQSGYYKTFILKKYVINSNFIVILNEKNMFM